MKSKDLISMALRNLNNRKLRTFLTVLGVVIGATSIIIMLSIGFGFQKINQQSYESMGDLTTLDMHSERFFYDESPSSSKKEKLLNDSAVSEVKKIEHVQAVMPMYKGNATLETGRFINGYVNIVAIPADAMGEFGFEIEEGRLLNSQDSTSGGVVVSNGVKRGFYNEKQPGIRAEDKIDLMKARIEIKDFQVQDFSSGGYYSSYNFDENFETKQYVEKLKVVGVLVDNPNDWENYNTVYMTLDYFKKFKRATETATNTKGKDLKTYSNIKVKVDDMKNVEEVQETIKSMGYEASNMYADILKESNKQIVVVQAVFGAIGAIAFIVAAIGITNTMIMSIYERTKEIGVMKVIGASIRDIKKLFLVESGFIGFFGGIAGIIFSLILSFLINHFFSGFMMGMVGPEAGFTPKLSYIPVWLIFVSLLFSTLVGVLSGYLPARRAMKLSALDAIRSK
ncbi:ABC transporter permease [Anaerosphaera multitolerans]|uniref:ABC transporter permease n=1 Tax=Anaerosphaera multitolerans TaxID=2487351 RepID=A0A437S4U7_9FIRM|nr:FtsX-like permease family protein [Anaerosphaera multitolerans]RVU53977.1 ABC transporter permease [Anaerosphaera multitolerans]